MLKSKQKHDVLRYRSAYVGLASRRLANTIRAAVTLDPKTFRYIRDHHLAVQTYLDMTIIPNLSLPEDEAAIDIYIAHQKRWTICTDSNFDFIAVRDHCGENSCPEFTSLADFLADFNRIFRNVANERKDEREADVQLSRMLSPQFNEQHLSIGNHA